MTRNGMNTGKIIRKPEISGFLFFAIFTACIKEVCELKRKAWLMNKVLAKVEKAVKKETGYDLSIILNEPLKLKLKDGTIQLHCNVDIHADTGLIFELKKELGESE